MTASSKTATQESKSKCLLVLQDQPCFLALPVEEAGSRAQDILWQRRDLGGAAVSCIRATSDLPLHPTGKRGLATSVSTGTLHADKSHYRNPTHSPKPLLPFTNIYIQHVNFPSFPLKYIKPEKKLQVKKYQDFDINSASQMIRRNNNS